MWGMAGEFKPDEVRHFLKTQRTLMKPRRLESAQGKENPQSTNSERKMKLS
jgi:hypothetical protein